MALQQVLEFFEERGRKEDVLQYDQSSATVLEAAAALNVKPERIAKSLSLQSKTGEALLVVTAGDAKIDNAKFKQQFQVKAKMLDAESVVHMTGHPVGGVCPFALATPLPVYLDVSLKRFTTVFPACGSINSAIELTCDELEQYSQASSWVDVCKAWNERL